MNSTQLREQHKILVFLKDRRFAFYNNDKHERLELPISPQALSMAIKINEKKVVMLLTNLCVRELVSKPDGNRWEYGICDEGITACLEERLLREAKISFWDKLTKRVTLAITIVSSIVALAGFIYNYTVISPLKEENRIQQIKIRNFENQLRTIQESQNKNVR